MDHAIEYSIAASLPIVLLMTGVWWLRSWLEDVIASGVRRGIVEAMRPDPVDDKKPTGIGALTEQDAFRAAGKIIGKLTRKPSAPPAPASDAQSSTFPAPPRK